MKLQSLAIIFVIIVLPITMVLSEYISNLINAREIEMEYDTKLLNSTYDAIKAYQLNTVNNALGNVTTQKVDDIEAAAQTFFNSLTSSFNFSGYNSNVMQEYVPAIVFTMYDGYYIYSPFTNTLTEVGDNTGDLASYDTKFSEKGESREGLKPYVYYNCRYQIDDKNDFVITYTLDNYITIQGIVNGTYTYDCGYIYSIDKFKNGLLKYEKKDGKDTYTYNGVDYTENNTEELKEYIGNDEYSYVKINGKKYYIEQNYYKDKGEPDDPNSELFKEISILRDGLNGEYSYNNNRIFNLFPYDLDDPENSELVKMLKSGIFYIDATGAKNYSQTKGFFSTNLVEENKEFLKYYIAIKYNKSAYEYFKHAYEFSSMVLGDKPIAGYKDKAGTVIEKSYNLKGLKTDKAVIYGNQTGNVNEGLSEGITNIEEYGEFYIFDGEIERSSSNFNQHRKAVIRYIIETNLTTAIKGFSILSKDEKLEFIMPKISEEDWELIENDVCAISFMQGMPIGIKQYNSYAVVANTLTAEKVGESDIYILATDPNNNIYCKPNDKKLINGYKILEKNKLTYYPGIWKLNFEMKQDATNTKKNDTIIYQPMSYKFTDSNGNEKCEPYLGSYSSVMGTSDVEFIGGGYTYSDMYDYMENAGVSVELKKAYYFGLARERWGNYNVNNINYEIYQNSNGCDYFLNDYNVTGPGD